MYMIKTLAKLMAFSSASANVLISKCYHTNTANLDGEYDINYMC